ncbi:MAG: hypothetical protein OQK24_08625 [Magnetovibrio sp.]|nr:hypothetical protein [Magnetovibrio sp.]
MSDGTDQSNQLSAQTGERRTPNKSLRDAVSALLMSVEEIFATSIDVQGSLLRFARSFNHTHISDVMIYEEDGKTQYVSFGHFIPPQSIDHSQHEKLFWLVNDISAVQLLQNTEGNDDLLEQKSFGTAFNAAYVSSYLQLLLKHIDQKLFENLIGTPEQTQSHMHRLVTQESDVYVSKLRQISGYSASYNQMLNNMASRDDLPSLPIIPIAIGNVLDEGAVLLNIYMDKHKGEQMKTYLAAR